MPVENAAAGFWFLIPREIGGLSRPSFAGYRIFVASLTARRTVSRKPNTKVKEPARSDRSVSDAIGRQLQSLYDDVLREPVPAELSELVERLAKEASEKKHD